VKIVLNWHLRDKFALSKNRMSIREGYFINDFFKMNVINIVTMDEKKIIIIIIIIIIHIILIYLSLMTCGMTS
jgi:hypothetical protein